MRATYSPSTFGMHHISLRHGLRSFSASRRRTVSLDRLSWSVSLTMASAKSSSVPPGAPLGGFCPSRCPQQGLFLAGELALCAWTRILAQRPFQIAFHEAPLGPVHGGAAHRHRAGHLFIAAGGIGRQPDLGALEFAGGSFALAQHRGELTAFGLAQFDPITYIHLDLLVGGPDESTNESKIRRRSQLRRSRLHRKARPVPGFHLHLYAHVPTPARRDRHAAPLSSQPTFGPPDDRDTRTKWPHPASTRRRPKHPNPRCSGRLAHPRLVENQPVIITVMRY